MSKRQKWIIIILCEAIAIALMTVVCQLLTGHVFGPVPLLAVVFIIYGIGRLWTRSPSGGSAEN